MVRFAGVKRIMGRNQEFFIGFLSLFLLLNRRGLGIFNPTDSHESHKLELLGSREARVVREVSKLIRTFDPQVLFLMETLKKSEDMEHIKFLWKFESCLTVDFEG